MSEAASRAFALKDLFDGFGPSVEILGDPETVCEGLTSNSRDVKPGSLFAALRGELVDGHRFIPDALARGARAVLLEHLPETDLSSCVWVKTPDTRRLWSEIVKRYFRDPASSLKLIGVTGTNGKTTTSYLLEHFLSSRGGALLVGTVEYRIAGKTLPSLNTTPGIYEISALMDEARRLGARYGVFEVSSHALKQDRLAGLKFRTAVFTNLTRDHMDYHRTFEDYYTSKRKLFERHAPEISIINRDDPYGEKLLGELNPAKTRLVSYSACVPASSWASEIKLDLAGTSFLWRSEAGTVKVASSLICRHSVYNLLAAMTAAREEGMALEEIAGAVARFAGVKGRMERVSEGLPFHCFVDYAHTPDAVRNVLDSVRYLIPRGRGRVITVFGCGGDRDKTKRPLMGHEAERLSDEVFLTSDNPRTEPPEAILEDIARGMKREFHRIPDRREAIGAALQSARPGDAVLVLGKGHEDYQVLGTQKIPFSDQEVVREWARAR